jgi:hypothetical protein
LRILKSLLRIKLFNKLCVVRQNAITGSASSKELADPKDVSATAAPASATDDGIASAAPREPSPGKIRKDSHRGGIAHMEKEESPLKHALSANGIPAYDLPAEEVFVAHIISFSFVLR